MKHSTLILVIVAFLITVGIVTTAVIVMKNTTTSNQSQIELDDMNASKTATLVMNPNASGNSVDVVLDTGGTQVSGAQLVIQYDPATVSNVAIAIPSTSPFGNVNNYQPIIQDVDTLNGRITFAVGLSPQGTPIAGNNTVATISYTPNPNASSAKFSFAPTTIVTKLGSKQTVLKEIYGTTIPFNAQ